MKIIYSIIIATVFYIVPHSVVAQNNRKEVVTSEFAVEGVCNMCKARIETAGLIKGVKFIEWNQETGILKVIYKNNKVSELDIHNAIAKEGHRTDQVSEDTKAYNDLPKCCAYDSNIKKH